MDRLRVGVVGLGAFGESHLRAYRGVAQVEVVAVASRSGERAREIAARYGIPHWQEEYQSRIDDPAIDAIRVTTAETDHLAPTLAAGKHALVEKPAARRANAFLMLGHILRFEPKHATLKHAVETNQLASIVSLSAQRNRPRNLISSHRRVDPALVTAIHDVDVISWLARECVKSVRAHHWLAQEESEAPGSWARMKFADGAIGALETTGMLPVEAGLDSRDRRFGRLRARRSPMSVTSRCFTAPTVLGPEVGLAALKVVLAAIEPAERNGDVTVNYPATLG